MLIRNFQVAHNFFTILLYNSALLSGQPKSSPGKYAITLILAQLTTVRKNELFLWIPDATAKAEEFKNLEAAMFDNLIIG